MRPRTLRGRLSLAALAVATVSIVVLTTVFNVLLVRRLNAQAESVLRANASAAAATVAERPDGTLRLVDERDLDLLSGIWVFQGNDVLEAPPATASLRGFAVALAGTNHKLVHRNGPKPVALYSLAVISGGHQVGTIVAAISLEPYRHSTRITVAASIILGALLLVLVLALARSLVGRALTPVAEMTSQARAWSEAGTAERFGEAERPGELAQLAATLDDLLDRLSAVLRREQHLSAEISHELRTPLAGIMAETELFAARPRSAAEAQRAMEVIHASARRMDGILETLLSAARADAGASLGRADTLSVVEEAVEVLGPTRVPIDVEVGEGHVLGVEHSLAERALAPLLENAVRHAVSEVRVSASERSSVVAISVKDDGPGVAPEHAEEVFEPGWQLDDTHGGAGLGLALARRLARAAGGDVVWSDGQFVLTLPRG